MSGTSAGSLGDVRNGPARQAADDQLRRILVLQLDRKARRSRSSKSS